MAKTIETINPYTNEVIGSVTASTFDEINDSVNSARDAAINWGKISLSRRLEYLQGLPKIVEKRKEQIAKLITEETGKPVTDSRIDLEIDIKFIRWYLENAFQDEVTYEYEKENS